jgi:zona occludens toxin
MILLFTGLPGSSKTLNTIKYVCENDLFCVYEPDPNNAKASIIKVDSDGNKLKRPVYYHNINELTLPWIKMTDDEAKQPHLIEPGAVIIYDECQDLFPVLANSKAGQSPEHYTYMNRHRHNGHDVIFVTQHPKNLNTQLRRLVNLHVHLKRNFGTKFVTRFEFQKCMDEPEEHFSKKESTNKTIEIDKKYFDVYKSAEVHTVQRKLPWGKIVKFGLMLGGTVGIIVMFVFLVKSMMTNFDDKPAEDTLDSTSKSTQSSILNPGTPDKAPDDYLDRLTPRIPDLIHTAPIYDELTEPVSFPRIAACVVRLSTDSCTCYTQQATRLDVSYDICSTIAAHGYFDPTLPDHRQALTPVVEVAKKQPRRPTSTIIHQSSRY